MLRTRHGLRPYLQRLVEAMGLGHWSIELADATVAEEDAPAAATMYAPAGRRVASIRISDSSLARTREEVRYLFVHELVHCHMAGLHNYLDEFTESRAYEIAYVHFYEYGVDAIATSWAQHLPLPPR